MMKTKITLALTDEQREALATFYRRTKRKNGGVGSMLAQPFAATGLEKDGTMDVEFFTQAEGAVLQEAFDAVTAARRKA